MLNSAISTAMIHVPFFKHIGSLFFTPMNWVLMPPMVPASPPPLGFCTKNKKSNDHTGYDYEYQEKYCHVDLL